MKHIHLLSLSICVLFCIASSAIAGQKQVVVVYVKSGDPAVDYNTYNSLSAMVSNLNAGNAEAVTDGYISSSDSTTYTLAPQQSNISAAESYASTLASGTQVVGVAQALEENSENGQFDDPVTIANGSAFTPVDGSTFESDFNHGAYYCGMFGDGEPITTNTIGGSLADEFNRGFYEPLDDDDDRDFEIESNGDSGDSGNSGDSGDFSGDTGDDGEGGGSSGDSGSGHSGDTL